MGKKLTDLTERTTTANTDLIHVNSSGTDYKESRSNFLKGDLYTTLSNSQTITASAESLPAPGTYFGYISSYSHQSATGMPENANFYVKIERIASTGYIFIDVWNIDGAENSHYTKTKRNGTWDSTWTKIPSRSEMALGNWTENLTLPYTPTSDGFISVWLNPSSTSGAYARLSVTGSSHAIGLNAKGGDGVTLVFPIKKNSTVSQAALSNGTLSVRFISIFS